MRKHLFTITAALIFSLTLYSQNNYNEVSLPQLLEKTKKGDKGYIILDVRSTGEYVDTVPGGKHVGIGRIKTAINIPIQDLLQKPEAIAQLEKYKGEDVYVICSHSYRSRRISNLLLEKGFKQVNNVKGGMSEWYRNYDVLQPYAAAIYENNISYHNMAPAQLFRKLKAKEQVELIGFRSAPKFFFDSLVAPLYTVFPDFRNVTYFQPADTVALLEKLKGDYAKTIVLFNTIGGGATDAAVWLTQKGFKNVNHLVGNLAGFYEYLANYQPTVINEYMPTKSGIQYYTPLQFCKNTPENVQWVDIRHDTTFNKVTQGTKLNYKTLKGAVNFPFYKNADDFENRFPDKKKLYILLPEQGYAGVELANALIKKGYKIGWIIGGIERWEWYSNNIDEFKCADHLVM